MRLREKLTLEEKVSLALALIKRERSLAEIRSQFRVSHTTAYKVRNLFLDGGRRALGGISNGPGPLDLEARVQALEEALGRAAGPGRNGRRERVASPRR